ncbi:MAG TPA: alpha/beta hydrolase, partial [Stellaceae bacterium]|nr:alpha/beta hydrolase [Stellaceae bacterium]
MALIGLVLAAAPAAGETRFGPGYPDRPLQGPQAAKGAVIWNHGTTTYFAAKDSSLGAIPVFVTLLRDAGWDVYRLDRPPQGEAIDASRDALLAAIADLKGRGYRRIVLAGQSAGAWISLIVAGRTADVHAVIVNAPAYYGVDRPRYTMNATALYDHLDAIKSGRVMVSYFAEDPFDPGGRGVRTDEILARRGVAHLVIDQPDGFLGHDSGNSGLFYRRFGPCVLAMAGEGPVPRRADCETTWGRQPSGELALPASGLATAAASPAVAPFLGAWWGTYTSGREVFLGVTRTEGDHVE